MKLIFAWLKKGIGLEHWRRWWDERTGEGKSPQLLALLR
jgi:hypothetical protein